jgi:hypothetical protein
MRMSDELTDAVGGTSPEAHRAGLDRIAQAGGQPTSVVQVGCELQGDWARQETVEGFTQILFGGDRPLAGRAPSLPITKFARADETAAYVAWRGARRHGGPTREL